jgi:hypothetical protein
MSPREVADFEYEVKAGAGILSEAIRALDYGLKVGRMPTAEQLDKLLVQLRQAQDHIDAAAQGDFYL